jgi:hypothetical protein
MRASLLHMYVKLDIDLSLCSHSLSLFRRAGNPPHSGGQAMCWYVFDKMHNSDICATTHDGEPLLVSPLYILLCKLCKPSAFWIPSFLLLLSFCYLLFPKWLLKPATLSLYLNWYILAFYLWRWPGYSKRPHRFFLSIHLCLFSHTSLNSTYMCQIVIKQFEQKVGKYFYFSIYPHIFSRID